MDNRTYLFYSHKQKQMIAATLFSLAWYIVGLLAMAISCNFSKNAILSQPSMFLLGALFGPIMFIIIILDRGIDKIKD
jgi:hypothetical protein